jgi:hypothetical protein
MHRDDNCYMNINCFNSMYSLSKPGSHRVFRICTVVIASYKKCGREMPTVGQPSAKLESSLAIQAMVLSLVSGNGAGTSMGTGVDAARAIGEVWDRWALQKMFSRIRIKSSWQTHDQVHYV